jgi:two-component system cell cycle sensor histidine kinase/response regulator CckA
MPPPFRPPASSDDYQNEALRVLGDLVDKALPVAVAVGLVAVAGSMVRAAHTGWRTLFSLHAVLVVSALVVYLLRKRISRAVLVGSLVVLAAVDGIANMLTFGLATNGLLVLGCACIFASLAFGRRVGVAALGLAILAWSAAGIVVTTGVWLLARDVVEQLYSGWSWLSQIAASSVFVFMTLTAAHAVQRRLLESVRDEAARTAELIRANEALRRAVEDRQRAEVNLANKDQMLRLIAEHTSDVMFVQDMSLRVVYVSPSVTKLCGYTPEEVMDTTIAQLMTPESLERAMRSFGVYLERARLGDVDVPLMEYEYVRKDGTRFWGELRVRFMRGSGGEITGSLGILRDVTDRKRAEEENAEHAEQQRQAEKMRAIGQLAGGIAHDFNNQLTGILMSADLVRRGIDQRPDLLRYIDFIRTAATRSAELTAKLLAFARKAPIVPVPVDVHDVVAEVVAILERSVDKAIAIDTRLEASRHVLLADPAQLQNALLNIALNARDALAQGGTIAIHTETRVLDTPRRFSSGLTVAAGPVLCLTVRDDGVGMDDATRARIFEPFFTTRAKGQGTGLGLAMVYAAVESLGGGIDVISAPGVGTSFCLYLPLSPESATPASTPATDHVVEGHGRVMLVEDEDIVRQAVREMLGRAGYDVEVCEDGEAAIQRISQPGPAWTAVVLDLVLPKRPGREVLAHLRKIAPALPVLVVSGYSHENKPAELADRGPTAFVQKPFSAARLTSELARLVRNARGVQTPDADR